MTARRITLLAALLVASTATAGVAQPCPGTACELGRRAAESTLGGVMLASGGGNPWLGSASTLGFRTVTFPRLGVQLRTGFAGAEVPDDRAGDNRSITPIGLNGAFSMAVFDGFAPASTVAGVGSVDVFASAGVVFLPGDAGFGNATPFVWSGGARVGLVRESFTAPGVTASLAYRRAGQVTFDRAAVLAREAGFFWEAASAWQARGVVGKRVSAFAFSGGFGWDGSGADVTVASRNLGGLTVTDEVRADTDRWQAFLDVTWTSLIASVAGEIGWQFAGGAADALGSRDPAAAGRLFGALGGRLTF